MPRFAILHHDYPTPHWDLFLEAGGSLRSWRLHSPLNAEAPIPAETIGDHRLVYLDYEGPVSGGRGTVIAIDRGTFDWMIDGPEMVRVQLNGLRFRGELSIAAGAAAFTSGPSAEPVREQSPPIVR